MRSGHADGADYAFEKGAKDRTVVYLPFEGYNKKLPLLTKHALVLPDANHPDYKDAHDSVDKFHPNPAYLTPVARKLMARNYLQIFGLGNVPTDLVICCARRSSTKEKGHRVEGGTGQAVAIADHYNIPVYNLFYEHVDDVHQAIDTFYIDNIVPLHL